MNFDFSEDQKFLAGEARKFLEAESAIPVVREVLNDDDKAYSEGLWKKIAEMGWLGTAVPEEQGGLGLGMLEMCVLAEEMGRVLAPVPFSSTAYYLTEAIKLAGSDEVKNDILPRIVAGEIIGCYAASEGPGHPDPASLKTTFDGSTVSGTKIPVTDGGIATHAVVLAKEGSGASLVLVDLSGAGVTRKALSTLDPTRGHAELTFDKTPGIRLGKAGEGASLNDQLMDKVAVLLAFEQLGGASRALEMAKEYSLERYAFGRPIAGNQAIDAAQDVNRPAGAGGRPRSSSPA